MIRERSSLLRYTYTVLLYFIVSTSACMWLPIRLKDGEGYERVT